MPKIITIIQIKKLATNKKGECLSKLYKGAFVKLKWRCSEGHLWEATPDSVKHGSWCPACSLKKNGLKRRKYTIKEMQILATKNGGKCLSKKCLTITDKLRWKCSVGHVWEATPGSIIQGRWCRLCGIEQSAIKRSHNIDTFSMIAKKKEGKLLSQVYKNTSSKLEFICKESHKWKTSGASILSGSWCPECAKLISSIRQRGNIEDMRILASSRGGQCLSNEYTNSQTNLTWQCVDGHIWQAKPNNVQSGVWCPECNNYIGENLVRAYFENIFGKKFPKTKPKWLLSKNGTRMELDGFCEELKLAFEHHGRQHYQKTIYSVTSESLKKRKADDLWKEKVCKTNNVKLITIPEVGYYVQIEKLSSFIIQQLKSAGYKITKKNIKNSSLEIQKISSQLRVLQDIAVEKGGKLLSKVYLGNTKHLEWECQLGHIWKASPSKIRQGRWCHKCNKKHKFTIEKMHSIARERKGKCLSLKYINGKNKLKWECKDGHIWQALPTSVNKGHWCPFCATVESANRTRGTIEQMVVLAKAKKGFCLSKKYITARTNLKWQCRKGHVWEATPGSIKSGSWCRECHLQSRKRNDFGQYT